MCKTHSYTLLIEFFCLPSTYLSTCSLLPCNLVLQLSYIKMSCVFDYLDGSSHEMMVFFPAWCAFNTADFSLSSGKRTKIIVGIIVSVSCLIFLLLSILWKKGWLGGQTAKDRGKIEAPSKYVGQNTLLTSLYQL